MAVRVPRIEWRLGARMLSTKTETSETSSETKVDDAAKATGSTNESIVSKFAEFTKAEIRNLAEVIKANQGIQKIPKRRLLDETAVPYQKLDDEDISTLDPAQRSKAKADAERAARAALRHSQGLPVPNPDELAKLPESSDYADAATTTGPVETKQIMVVEQSKGTVWSERINSLKETIFGSFRRSVRTVTRVIDESDNAALSKIRDVKYAVQDKLEDVRETYETSQHPLIWKLRDVHDRATMGSEAALATERLNIIDPTYNEDELKKDVEEYIIPVLVGAILRGDLAVVKSMCGGQALAGLQALFQERATRGVQPDSLILDVAHVEIYPPQLVNDIPHVKVSFSCQQVNCLRNAKGEIVEGGETDIVRVMYVLMLKREFDNPDTDWRTVQLYMQQVLALV